MNGHSVVVKAPNRRLAELATNTLAHRLLVDQRLFLMVGQPTAAPSSNATNCYSDFREVRKNAEGLTTAQPLIATLAGDPSLRGVMKTLSLGAQWFRAGLTNLGGHSRWRTGP